ncbi:DUF192 domain-containing protein [Candidatus Woesearchaeota archaeon]|nr:DUF192 domain-containing protein [Candidatus Woesearchaeota archaeon]
MGLRYLVILLLMLVLLGGCGSGVSKRVCFGDKCMEAEVVSTPEEKRIGLMGREGIDNDKVMLFVWEEEGVYSIWMKNMKFSIDIIWVGKDLKVKHTESNVPPCRADPCEVYMPREKVLYVVETVSGFVSKNNIKNGDAVRLTLDGTNENGH